MIATEINKPRIAPWLIALYFGPLLLTLLIALMVDILIAKIIALIIAFIMFLHIIFISKTQYVLSGNTIHFKSLYGSKKIYIPDIKSIKPLRYREIFPLIRYFGSTMHTGYHWHHVHKKIFMCITNTKDLVLIETKDKKYLISPSNQKEFIKKIIKIKKLNQIHI